MEAVKQPINRVFFIHTPVSRLDQIISDAQASGEGVNHYLSDQLELGHLTTQEFQEVLLYSIPVLGIARRLTYH